MSVIEAALMNTARASFGLLAAYTVKTNCLFIAQRQAHFSFTRMHVFPHQLLFLFLSIVSTLRPQ